MALEASAQSRTATVSGVSLFTRTLRWAVLSLLIVGTVHFFAELTMPDLRNIFVPPVIAPILLAFGIWVGYKMVSFGGSFGHVILAGIILGLLPLMLDVFGFGILLGRGTTYGILTGVFGMGMVLFGALIGGGFGLTR